MILSRREATRGSNSRKIAVLDSYGTVIARVRIDEDSSSSEFFGTLDLTKMCKEVHCNQWL
jgi:hypothetical protein